MSAAGRGAVRKEADFYPTPFDAIAPIIKHLNLPRGDWLEPSAGEGAIIAAVNKLRRDVFWTACELRPQAARQIKTVDPTADIFCDDFLRADWLDHYKVAILNPPFSLALEFIEKCMSVADWVVCLERINFLGSAKRNDFWRAHAPDVYLLSKRPSFVGGPTDSTEYAWFVYPPEGHNRSQGLIEVLPLI